MATLVPTPAPAAPSAVPTVAGRKGAEVRPACWVRAASLSDVPALVALEQASFDTDRLTRRQFRYLLTQGNAETLICERDGQLAGYVLVLFSQATSTARLYSIAVAAGHRGKGVGRALVAAAEAAAQSRDRAYLRLEVRRDNAASRGLFESLGYRELGVYEDYYEDHMPAVRYEKSLAPHLNPDLGRVPYYEQTLDFTCGSSSLMMAMKALDPSVPLDRTLELRIWREATTIFMTSGHGGCGPYGLALSALRRGFRVDVFVNDEGVPLVDSVRSPEKKEVMRLVHEDFIGECRRRGIPIQHGTLSVAELRERFRAGGIPLVLISSYRIYEEKFPHWVVVTGFDDHFVYAHDPYVDYADGESQVDSINMPIPHREFARMARYGRAGLQAVVIVYRNAVHG
jgi:ribosomal protein S18 acetylase RimI-like enzyme